MLRKFPDLCLIVLFLLVLWMPVCQMRFGWIREPENTENRMPADKPSLQSLRELPGFIRDYERYFNDAFGLRNSLIRWNNLASLRAFGSSPVREVIVGKDSWLFYRSEALADGESIEDFLGNVRFSREGLQAIASNLERNREEFAKSGIVYLVAIAPNKQTIYPEYLPDGMADVRRPTRLDQLIPFLRIHTGVEVIDLRKPLLEAKGTVPSYLQTDTHWNEYGAYIGYLEILRHLTKHFPGLAPMTVADSRIVVDRSPLGGDLAKMLSLPDRFPEGCEVRLDLSAPPGGPRLGTLCFRHDSFGDALYRFWSKHFTKVIGLAPFAPFHFGAIRAAHPDVVLHVLVERYVNRGLNDDYFYGQKEGTEPGRS